MHTSLVAFTGSLLSSPGSIPKKLDRKLSTADLQPYTTLAGDYPTTYNRIPQSTHRGAWYLNHPDRDRLVTPAPNSYLLFRHHIARAVRLIHPGYPGDRHLSVISMFWENVEDSVKMPYEQAVRMQKIQRDIIFKATPGAVSKLDRSKSSQGEHPLSEMHEPPVNNGRQMRSKQSRRGKPVVHGASTSLGHELSANHMAQVKALRVPETGFAHEDASGHFNDSSAHGTALELYPPPTASFTPTDTNSALQTWFDSFGMPSDSVQPVHAVSPDRHAAAYPTYHSTAGYTQPRMGPDHNIHNGLLGRSDFPLQLYPPANLLSPTYETALPVTYHFPHPSVHTYPIPQQWPSPCFPTSGARHMYGSSPSSSTGTHLSPWSNSNMSMYSTPASDFQSLPSSSSNSPYTSPSQHDAHSFEASAAYGGQAAFTGMPACESRVFRDGLGVHVDGLGPLRTQQNLPSELDRHIGSLVGEDVFNTLDPTLSMSPIGFQLNGNAYRDLP